MYEESRFCSVGGLRLHYFRWGWSGAQPLILLHDLGEAAEAWAAVIPELSRQFGVIAVDLRGHGDSDWIDTYSPQEQGDDIGELVGVLGLTPAVLVGAGMGGRAAALLAARQEHAVSRVVLLDTGVRMYTLAEREADEAILAMPRVYDSPRDYQRRWLDLRASLGLRYSAAVPDDPMSRLAAERIVRGLVAGGYAPKFDADGYQRYRAWSPGTRAVDYHDEFDQIDCPVLLVRGADSPILSREDAGETAAAIPRCEVVDLPAARHDLVADNPAALLDALLPFARRAI